MVELFVLRYVFKTHRYVNKNSKAKQEKLRLLLGFVVNLHLMIQNNKEQK